MLRMKEDMFTREELENAAMQAPSHMLSLCEILQAANRQRMAEGKDRYTVTELRSVASSQNASSLSVIIERATKARESIPSANDDDQVTIGELREAFRKVHSNFSNMTSDHEVDRLAKYIFDRREPVYPEGVIVKDANGDFWLRVDTDGRTGWLTFGEAHLYPDSDPKRPLEVQ